MLILMTAALAADELQGTWTADVGQITISSDAAGAVVQMTLRGDLLQQGELRTEGAAHKVAMNGCGATLTRDGKTLKVDLDGPECPIELATTYKLLESHCTSAEQSQMSCMVAGRRGAPDKRLEVCKGAAGLSYRYGVVGGVELTIGAGKASERNLMSGVEYGYAFVNDGYAYDVYVVESAKEQDNGAGVQVTKGETKVASLSCRAGTWTRAAE